MKKLVIDIYRLHNKLHHYEFEVDEAFFKDLDQDLISSGTLTAKINLDKTDSFIAMDLDITGTVDLICDRSLEKFQHPVNERRRVIFKYGLQESELEHDVIMITSETQHINVGNFIFEYVGLAIPMKKLHPRFKESEEEFGSMVYTSSTGQDDEGEETPDPRWNKLNDLKKN